MITAPVVAAVIGVIDKIIPDPQAATEAKLKAIELSQRGDLAQLDADVRLSLAQLEVNNTEAATDKFRGGRRPATGWLCVAGLGYQFLFQPFFPWFLNVLGASVPPLPNIDNEALFMLLTGMLGLGGLRTVERVKGKA